MSKWAYITGLVRADTFAKISAEAVYIGQTVIDHLPRVWGSEHDAFLHVHLEDGHNCGSDCDEYDRPSNLYTDRIYKTFESQSKILITISGDLRDATFDDTLRAAAAMICRMAKYVLVERCAVMIQDSYGKSVVITNRNGWMGDLCKGVRVEMRRWSGKEEHGKI